MFRSKGMAGKPLTTNPPFGYMKAPTEKDTWVVDEPAAAVVRNIFRMCISGLGPTQIAKRLKAAEVMTPTEYRASVGRECANRTAEPFNWCSDTVASILSRQEYCGDTVNFRSTTRSFKNKKKVERPQEDWQIFKDTHPAIISREDFALVQELRSHRRRPTKTGIISMFSGLVYCADCGQKLYYSATNNYKREQACFFCSSYRKDSSGCSSHFIREKVISNLVLKSLQEVFGFIKIYERRFVQMQLDSYSEDKKKELAVNRRELNKVQKRILEIDGLIQKIYEDNASGRLSDDRYTTMAASYENEQEKLKAKVPELETYLSTETDRTENVERFVEKVRSITRPTELTPELVHEFIERIEVSEARYLEGKRHQVVDIYYKGVGMIRGFSPEEMETAFQDGVERRRREKTA